MGVQWVAGLDEGPPFTSSRDSSLDPIAFVDTLQSAMPREVALFSGRMQICAPASAIVVSSRDGNLGRGGIMPAYLYDGLWGFSDTLSEGLAVSEASFHFPLKSSM